MAPASLTVLGTIVLASPAVAASANQFDLVCKGKEQKRTGVPATAWTERFRIDLDAKRWCRGTCKAPARIASVTADEILISDIRAAIGGPPDTELKLSRTGGTVSEAVMMGWSGSGASLADGTCRREYFSGFPGTARWRETDGEPRCAGFRPTPADIRRFLADAGRADPHDVHMTLPESPCVATGRLRFVGGGGGRWQVDRAANGWLDSCSGRSGSRTARCG